MGTEPEPVRIPNKSIFKSAEVCELLGIPSYVLRTWENEFQDLGVATSGSARSYRRRDVELALLIRQLVFTEHLTLAGVRRRLEQDHLLAPSEPEGTSSQPSAGTLTEPARARISQVKDELRALLQELASNAMSTRDSGTDSAAIRPSGGGTVRKGPPTPAPAHRSPSLPGLESSNLANIAARELIDTSREGKLDPSALNFATVSAPPESTGRKRRS